MALQIQEHLDVPTICQRLFLRGKELQENEATVAQLIAHVGLSQPLVSWHLGRLRAAGVVETRRQGRETVCRLREEAFSEFAARERAILGVVG